MTLPNIPIYEETYDILKAKYERSYVKIKNIVIGIILNGVILLHANNFLLADIDHDGKKERLQWGVTSKSGDIFTDGIYHAKLLDDDGSLLWKQSSKNEHETIVGFDGEEEKNPVVFRDIDGDGNTEIIVYLTPHEEPMQLFSIFRWNGEKFTNITKGKYNTDLILEDGPKGNTLKWAPSYSKKYAKKRKIWLVVNLWQSKNNELPIARIIGWDKDNYKFLFNRKAKIKFTPTGATIEEWIIDDDPAPKSTKQKQIHKKKHNSIGIVFGLDPHGDGFLSIRNKPKGLEIAHLLNGDKVQILGSRGKWYKIKKLRTGTIGWAYGKWISVQNN